MEVLDFFNPSNSDYIEQLYEQYRRDPKSVDERWAAFFAGFQAASSAGGGAPHRAFEQGLETVAASSRVGHLVHTYRDVGHLAAELDPLGKRPKDTAPFELAEFGFTMPVDLTSRVGTGGFLGVTDGTLAGLVTALKHTYCGRLGVEFMDIPDKDQRQWLIERMEPVLNAPVLGEEDARHTLSLLIDAQKFEEFLQTKYIGQKRFSVEGGESLVPLLDTLVEEGGRLGAEQLVFGMAHRGRLNALAHILHKPLEVLLREFEGTVMPEDAEGDVKYHLGFSSDRVTRTGHKVHCTLSHNPSHLELVNPVIEGMVYAQQQIFGDTERTRVIPVLVHGEAAFPGQGIVYETLNLSQLDCYKTGGTVHVILNNQIGFTAEPYQTRFTPYPTDVANAIKAPVFHVNGEDPEAVVHAARLAIQFRQKFRRDVMIDLWCYRKYGHNEIDDPTFTQPQMYQEIGKKKPVAEVFAETLVAGGRLSPGVAAQLIAASHQRLEDALALARGLPSRPKSMAEGFRKEAPSVKTGPRETRVDGEILQRITRLATAAPEGFSVHPKLKRLLSAREEMAADTRPVDWGCAEMWAFGSLLLEGTPVRLTGQDCERGTFSHRHAVLHDVKEARRFVPLENLSPSQGKFTLVNTMLSELAVLGFEYGYSRAEPKALVLWEAQFGDFVNGAQPILDQFVSSSEQKWQRYSALVLLLPHGFEGQGPEHSSARLERFLQLAAEDNLRIAYPTVPSQYFHLLRRQINESPRRPLILMMPKSLLRHPLSTSRVSEFTAQGFSKVLDDPGVKNPKEVKRVILCSGKVFFSLFSHREEKRVTDVALLRLEQLYPFAEAEIRETLRNYPRADKFLWVQEEPRNQGAWTFIHERLDLPLVYCGRPESASPATGMFRIHEAEEKRFLEAALSG